MTTREQQRAWQRASHARHREAVNERQRRREKKLRRECSRCSALALDDCNECARCHALELARPRRGRPNIGAASESGSAQTSALRSTSERKGRNYYASRKDSPRHSTNELSGSGIAQKPKISDGERS